jgi:DNA-binding CsgD family transcriptional regulator
LRLYRDANQPSFSVDDRITLASVMHYVSRGMAATELRLARDQLAFAYEDTEEEALLVTDSLGTIHFASESGMRLLLLATAPAITPAILRSATADAAARAIKAVCGRLEAAARGLEAAPASITLDSCWGRFVLRGYRLKAGQGSRARIGLRIQRQMPMILRFVDALGRQDLSPQQREIALRVALGLSNQEISGRLGVSLNTVAYHLKQIFLRLDVHTRTEAIEKIAWGETAKAAQQA